MSSEDVFDKGEPKKHYVILGQIGAGSYGNVYKVQDKKSQEFAALKVMNIDHPEDLEETTNEVTLHRSLVHPNIVAVLGAWKKGKVAGPTRLLYTWRSPISFAILMRIQEVSLALELCENGSTRDLFARVGYRPVPESIIAPIARGLLSALQFLHEKLVMHRDIKAANILITRTGAIKLSDFGVSCRLATRTEKRCSLIGTPHWLAPEVLGGTMTHLPYDLKADIWSFGITMVELAEGRPPLWEMDAMQVIIDVPRRPAPQLKDPTLFSVAFCDLAHSCLNKRSDARPDAAKLRAHTWLAESKSGPADLVAYVERTKQGVNAFVHQPTLPAPPRLVRPSRRQSQAMAQQAAQLTPSPSPVPSPSSPSSFMPIPTASSHSLRPISPFSPAIVSPAASAPLSIAPRPLHAISPTVAAGPLPSAPLSAGMNASAILSSSPPHAPNIMSATPSFMPSFSAPVSPRKISIPPGLAAPPSLTELAVKPVHLPSLASLSNSTTSSSSLSNSANSVPIPPSPSPTAGNQRTPSPSPPNQTSPLSSPKTSPRKRDTGVFNAALPAHMRSPQRERAFSGPSVPIAGIQRVNISPMRDTPKPAGSTSPPARAFAKTEATLSKPVLPYSSAASDTRSNSPFRPATASPARERGATGAPLMVGIQRLSPARSRPAGVSSPPPLCIPLSSLRQSSSPTAAVNPHALAGATGINGLVTLNPLSGSTVFASPPSPRSNYAFMPDLVRSAAHSPPSPRAPSPQPVLSSPRSNYEFLPDVAVPEPAASSSLLLNLPSSETLAENRSGNSQRKISRSSPANMSSSQTNSPRALALSLPRPYASGRPPLPSWIALFLRCGIAQDKAAAYERIFLVNEIEIDQMRDLNETILCKLLVAPEDIARIVSTLKSLAVS